jgi:3-hydroxyisobutyrate dehydrogenase-like beta-hydroxyacid dehydrogenase
LNQRASLVVLGLLVVVELSTLPMRARDRARRALAERGLVLLDAPISGIGAPAVHLPAGAFEA